MSGKQERGLELYPELRTVGNKHLLQSSVLVTSSSSYRFFQMNLQNFRSAPPRFFAISNCDIRNRLAKRRKKSGMTGVQLALLVKLRRDYRKS